MVLMGSVNLTFLAICLVFSTFPIVTIIFFLRVGKILKQLELSSEYISQMPDFCCNYQQISARSSFIGHVNATADGLPTIRCAKVENVLIDEFDSHQDLYTSASYLYLCWFRSLHFFVTVFFIFFVLAILLQFLIVDSGTEIVNLIRIS
jgi:ATP-binding cassette subfamily C (CFTR/MRP) protein 4